MVFCKWQRKPKAESGKEHLGNSSPHQPSKWNGYYLNQGNNETVSNNGSSVTLAKISVRNCERQLRSMVICNLL